MAIRRVGSDIKFEIELFGRQEGDDQLSPVLTYAIA